MKGISLQLLAGILLLAGHFVQAEPSPGADAGRVYRDGSEWVEELKGDIPAARAVRIRSSVGDVNVRGGNQDNVTYVLRKRVRKGSEASARRDFENFRLNVSKRGDTIYFEGNSSSDSMSHFSADFNINVPRAVESIKIETLGGGVAVNNVAGKVEAETAGGDLQMDGIGGGLRASTMGGNIDVGNITSDVSLRDAGGNITIRSASGAIEAQTFGGNIEVGTGGRSIQVQTAGGNITVKKSAGALHAITAGGSIDIGEVGGTAVLDTAGGNIRLGSARGKVLAKTMSGGIRLTRLWQGVQAKTAAGCIEAEFRSEHQPFAESNLETMSGDIIVYLPASLPVTVRAAVDVADGHAIRSDFKELKISGEGSEYGPRELYAEGSLNAGGPMLRMHTTVGDIEIHRGQK